jgi:hypothetical protein
MAGIPAASAGKVRAAGRGVGALARLERAFYFPSAHLFSPPAARRRQRRKVVRMTLNSAVASLKRRLAYATGAREAWRGSGEPRGYVAACARLDMLQLQLDKLAGAVRRADPR